MDQYAKMTADNGGYEKVMGTFRFGACFYAIWVMVGIVLFVFHGGIWAVTGLAIIGLMMAMLLGFIRFGAEYRYSEWINGRQGQALLNVMLKFQVHKPGHWRGVDRLWVDEPEADGQLAEWKPALQAVAIGTVIGLVEVKSWHPWRYDPHVRLAPEWVKVTTDALKRRGLLRPIERIDVVARHA